MISHKWGSFFENKTISYIDQPFKNIPQNCSLDIFCHFDLLTFTGVYNIYLKADFQWLY